MRSESGARRTRRGMVAVCVAKFQRTNEKIKSELILVGDLVSAPNTPSHFIVRLVVVKVEERMQHDRKQVSSENLRPANGAPTSRHDDGRASASLHHHQ